MKFHHKFTFCRGGNLCSLTVELMVKYLLTMHLRKDVSSKSFKHPAVRNNYCTDIFTIESCTKQVVKPKKLNQFFPIKEKKWLEGTVLV